jgi:hemerythrin
MAVEWSDDLSVGVEMIDSQHKELIRAVNRLTEAMWEGKGSEETGKLLSFLADYVVTHFGSEERLMVTHKYPKYEAHKEAHDRFTKDFLRMKSQYDQGEITTSLAIKVLDDTWEWLRTHIRAVDKELGNFVTKPL